MEAVADLELDSPSRSRKRARAEVLETRKEDKENPNEEVVSVKTPKKKRKVTMAEPRASSSDLVSKLFQRSASFARTLRGSGKTASKKHLTGSMSNPMLDTRASSSMDIDSIPRSSSHGDIERSASASILASTEVVSTVASSALTQKQKRLHRGNELSELKPSYSCTTLPRGLRTNRLSIFSRHNGTIFSPMIKEEDGWLVESGSASVTSMDLSTSTSSASSAFMMESHASMDDQPLNQTEAWYATFFQHTEHFNYLAVESTHGPVSISVMRDGDLVRAIVRTEKIQEKIAVPVAVLLKGSSTLGKKDKRGLLKAIIPPGWHLKNLREVKESKHIEDLVTFETNEMQTKFKWGVLYVKHDQKTEDEMFANNEMSPHFKEFLAILGETITLKDWTGYTGGLDTNKNMTGRQSVYTTFNDNAIMFHVAPMLPYDSECSQQLERKRHLGNDVVVIAFVENDNQTTSLLNDPAPYLPTTVRTHFQHVLAVVQRDPTSVEGRPRYRLHVARKSDVPSFGPELPNPSVFDKSQLRNVLLTKLINGERAAFKAPAFERAISRARSGFIQYYHKEYTKK
jgi:hypothetical protein